jgi:hypothetical protein
MSFTDFTRHFADLYICRTFKTVDQGGPWYRYTATGEWRGETAGGSSGNPTACKNPQYALAITRPTTVFISLTQDDKSDRQKDLDGIGIAIHDKQGNRIKNFYARDVVTKTVYIPGAEVVLEASLQPSSSGKPYTLFVSTYEPGTQKAYTLTVYSDTALGPAGLEPGKPDTLRKLPADAPGQ